MRAQLCRWRDGTVEPRRDCAEQRDTGGSFIQYGKSPYAM